MPVCQDPHGTGGCLRLPSQCKILERLGCDFLSVVHIRRGVRGGEEPGTARSDAHAAVLQRADEAALRLQIGEIHKVALTGEGGDGKARGHRVFEDGQVGRDSQQLLGTVAAVTLDVW